MLRRIKSAFGYRFLLTQQEAFEAARQGDYVALEKFIINMQAEAKIIKEEHEHEMEQCRKQGLPKPNNYRRGITEEYSVVTVMANSDLWVGIYRLAARYNHVNIMNLLHRSSCIVLNKMTEKDLEITLVNAIYDVSKEGLQYMFSDGALNKKVWHCNNHKRIAGFLAAFQSRDYNVAMRKLESILVYKYASADLREFINKIIAQLKYRMMANVVAIENIPSELQSANRDLQAPDQAKSIFENSTVLSLGEEIDSPPLELIMPAVPNDEDSNIFHSASIVAKDTGEADKAAYETNSSSSNMEPVVSNSAPSKPNNLQSTEQTKKWETLIQSLPNDYLNSNDNTDNLKRDLESLKYQVSQIQAGLSSQIELTHELSKQKMLMEQLDYIANGDEIVLAYFMQLKLRLTNCFIASRIISSGMVERAPYLLTDKLKKLLGDFSSMLTGVASFAEFASTEVGKTATEALKSLGEGLHIGGFMKELLPNPLCELLTSIIESEEHCIERVAFISSGKNYTLSGLEYTAELIALTLTYLYRPQIKCLTEEGAKLLAQCSAERVMLLGKEGIVNRSNQWVPVVIALIGQPTIKQTKNFREIAIETKPEYQGRWTENGIHCKSGIMCLYKNDVIFFSNDESKQNKYGFRINSRSIAEKLYMMKVLASGQVSEYIKRTSSHYFSFVAVSHPPELVEKTSCDDVQKSNEDSSIPTSFTSSADQNTSLYILRRLQELESKVQKLESDNSKLHGEKAELEDKMKLMQSNVSTLSRRQHEHQGKFDNLRRTGVDIDMPEEAGSVLLQSRDFTDANSKGTFFLAQQTQIVSRLGILELEVAAQRDAQKLHGNE